jgi:hypothetical protein
MVDGAIFVQLVCFTISVDQDMIQKYQTLIIKVCIWTDSHIP